MIRHRGPKLLDKSKYRGTDSPSCPTPSRCALSRHGPWPFIRNWNMAGTVHFTIEEILTFAVPTSPTIFCWPGRAESTTSVV
jgi:hypothetical protein